MPTEAIDRERGGTLGSERGMSLAEALVVVAVIGLAVAGVGAYGLRWMRAERQRSAIYETYIHMSLARFEALKRNRDCRFTIDTATRTIRVLDLNDPSTSSDDQIIASAKLDPNVVFGRPDLGAAVTLPNLSGSTYGATFRSDGALSSSGGSIGLADGVFRRLTVYVGGAVAIERWNGSAWIAGS